MEAHETCVNCADKFRYIPFICDLCGGSMCINCTNADGTSFCENCKDIQAVSYELAKPQPKCDYCNENALFVQPCTPVKNNKKGARKKHTCVEIIQVCKDHINKCGTCGIMLCKCCAKYQRCKKHLEYCASNAHFVPAEQIVHCANCGKKQCNVCYEYRSIYTANVRLSSTLMLCSSHITRCKCTQLIYDAPHFVCGFSGCNTIACQAGWFKSLIGEQIYACHNHTSECPFCDKIYPDVNQKNIKFRGDKHSWICCSNCWGLFYNGVIGFLSIWMWNDSAAKLPKDVLDMIFRQHLNNIKKNSSKT